MVNLHPVIGEKVPLPEPVEVHGCGQRPFSTPGVVEHPSGEVEIQRLSQLIGDIAELRHIEEPPTPSPFLQTNFDRTVSTSVGGIIGTSEVEGQDSGIGVAADDLVEQSL